MLVFGGTFLSQRLKSVGVWDPYNGLWPSERIEHPIAFDPCFLGVRMFPTESEHK